MITGELKNKIDGIWDIFWSAGMTNPLTVIEQLTYLMFIKILDDNELRKEANAAAFDLPVQNPTFGPDQQHCRWSKFRHLEPETMFQNMVGQVFPFIKEGLQSGRDTAFSTYMKDALFLVPTARVLVRVVDALNDLDLNNKDIMGDVYEYLLSQIAQSGTNGQFRTPRHIIQMMVDLMRPTLEDTICDPAMGTAGFICAAAQYITDHYGEQLMKKEHMAHYNQGMFTGFDTDQTMLRIGAMNMMLHGVEAPHIAWMDSLSEDNSHREEYSLIMANPPFTGSLDRETIAKDLLALTSSRKTELLFLSLFVKALKVGGRCASIVPDGVLFGSSRAHKALRQELVDNQRLEAVISMPSGVFKPYAGVSTAVIIFTKTNHGGTDQVWFYDMQADGYSLDDKRGAIEENDIPDIVARFHSMKDEEGRARTDRSFLVPREEIVEQEYDLSINRYKEVVREEVVYDPPKVILERIEKINSEIEENIRSLRDLLHD